MPPFIEKLISTPDAAYPDVIKIALLAAVGVILLHSALSATRGKQHPRPRWNWWSRLVYLGTITAVAILGATAIYSVLAHGHMEEWSLLIHMGGAGMFTACLALIALTFAHRNRFGAGKSEEERLNAPFSGLTKITFWLLVISGTVTAATMLFSMLPIMGTHDMEQMLTIHRYSGLMLVVVTVVHVYLVVMGKLGRA